MEGGVMRAQIFPSRVLSTLRSAVTAPGMWLAWLVLLACLMITAWAWDFLTQDAERQANRQFQAIAAEIGSAIEQRMVTYEQVLQGGLGLFAASVSVQRNEWQQYVQRLNIEERLPGIQGVGFSVRVAPEDREAHIRSVRAEGFPDYTIKPPGTRPEYTAVMFLEPFNARNRRAFGFDMFSEPVRRAAMERARDSGKAAVSGKVKLVQETGKDVQAGFLMYLPLYRKGVALDTVEQRRAALLGYVFSPFRMNNLMHGILTSQTQSVDLEIFDGDEMSQDTLMFDDDSVPRYAGRNSAQFTRTGRVDINGRTWTLLLSSLPAFEAQIDRQLPRLAAQTGIVISMLMFAIIWSLVTNRSRALALAQTMTTTLREREAFISSVVDNAVDGIITIDRNGSVVSFNPAAEKIFGYESAEVLGQNIKMLMPEPYQAEHDGYLAHHVATGERKVIGIGREVSGMRKNGEIFPLDLAVSDMSQGQRSMFTGIVRDITERKKVDRLKNEFVSTVSHELRTPLTSIRGSLGLIAGGVAGELPAQAKSLIDIAYKNSERLISLINDILDVEKIESGKMHFELKPLKLMPLIEHALEANYAYGEQFGVKFGISSAIPEAHVFVDQDRMMQVMSNLLSNAAKFSPPGERVGVSVARANGKLRVSVSDRGPGIPEDFRDKIFQKFSQADSSDTRQKGGTGLGLSIARAIVEKMDGSMGFESQAGVGTTFYFELPELHEEAPLHSGVTREAGAATARILICEDDRDIASLIRMMLEQAGFDADIAHDAAQAKEMLAQRHYAAMTLDLALPGQDGLSLIHELRAHEATRHLPIVVVSARAEEGRLQLDGGIPVVDWLSKPIDHARLIEDVRHAAHSIVGHGARILHIEDDPDIREVVASVAKDIAEFDYAGTLQEARDKLAVQRYQLIVLDIGLPDGSGWELLPVLSRLAPQPPVLIFSAQDVGKEEGGIVKAALTKSQTSNEQLLATIRSLVLQGNASPTEHR
jgi:PAS domain S-box-containing protein